MFILGVDTGKNTQFDEQKKKHSVRSQPLQQNDAAEELSDLPFKTMRSNTEARQWYSWNGLQDHQAMRHPLWPMQNLI